MQKKKVFKLEDSNIEGIGTDVDKKCRESAASTEKAWKKVKGRAGMWAWRIEQFKVKKNDDALSGVLYNDDSYIILKSVEDPETKKLSWDVHFWLGETTTQDEYGTAAYKTVELDDFVNGKGWGDPVQHREVSGHESGMFMSYFPNGIRLLTGGAASGFNHVEPEGYKARLLWVKGKKKIRVVECDILLSSLNSGDVFILDAGLNLYQFQAKGCGMKEKSKGAMLQRSLDDERKGKPEAYVFSQIDKPDDTIGEFFSYFVEDLKEEGVTDHKQGTPVSEEVQAAMMAKIPEGEGGDDHAYEKESNKILMQLSDADGELKFTEVSKGTVKKDGLVSDDVFIFDIGMEIFVWIGNAASKSEKKNGMRYASQYLKDYERPPSMPVTQIYEGGENEVFENSFD